MNDLRERSRHLSIPDTDEQVFGNGCCFSSRIGECLALAFAANKRDIFCILQSCSLIKDLTS